MRLQPIALASLCVLSWPHSTSAAKDRRSQSDRRFWPYPVFPCALCGKELKTEAKRRPASITPDTYNKGFSAFDW
jgi:hypothetical protein